MEGMEATELKVVGVKEEKFWGSLPIRLVEDASERMLEVGDVIEFKGKWTEFKGYYVVTRTTKFSYRKSEYLFNNVLYPVILQPGKSLQLSMDDLLTKSGNVLTEYRIGIPEGISVILSYPKSVEKFAMDNRIYTMRSTELTDKGYIGAYTSIDSPFDAPRLEVTNVVDREQNVYLTVRNDSADYRKAVLHLIVNKVEIAPTQPRRDSIAFYSPELIL